MVDTNDRTYSRLFDKKLPANSKTLRRTSEISEIVKKLRIIDPTITLETLFREKNLGQWIDAHMSATKGEPGGEIFETVKVDNALFALKVADTVEKGAEFEGKLWRNLARVFDMPEPASKINIPQSSELLYQTMQGYGSGTQNTAGGGAVTHVSLDTTPASTIRYVFVNLNEDDVRSRQFNTVEVALQDAGNALATSVLRSIVMQMITDSAVTGAGTAGQYDVLLGSTQTQMEALGFYPDNLLITPAGKAAMRTEAKTTGGFMPFAMNWFPNTFDKAGQIASVWDMDVLEVAWLGVGTDDPDFIVYNQNKFEYIGLGEDINVRGPEEDLLRGMTQAKIQIRYVQVVANANAGGIFAI